MKNILIILLTVISLTISLIASSCSKEEDHPSIVGSWTCDDHYYRGSDTFLFKKNGTYKWIYHGDWAFEDQSGKYAFNGVLLTLSTSKGHTVQYVVTTLTLSSMVLMDEDGYSYLYYKD